MSIKKDVRQFHEQLERRGFIIKPTSGGHLRITHPDMQGVVHSASTPSDYRGLKNLKSEIRKRMPAGWQW